MNSDLFFVVGAIIAVFALPAAISALLDGRAPRAAAIAVMIGGGLVFLAVYQRPGAYSLEAVPDVFMRVVARFLG